MSDETPVTIYAVSTGSYSDYRVNALFSTREKAQAFIDLAYGSRDDADIEEYELDLPAVDNVARGLKVWDVFMRADGHVEKVELQDGLYVGSAGYHWIVDRKKWVGARFKPEECDAMGNVCDAMGMVMWARDKEHAIKIANERRVALLASGEWKHETPAGQG